MTDREALEQIWRIAGAQLVPVDGTPPPSQPPVQPVVEGSYLRQVEGHPPIDGRYLVGFAHPADAPILFEMTVEPTETRRWQMGGAEGWAQGDITVSVNGQPVDRDQQQIGPGFYHIEVRCVDSPKTREHGVGRTALEFYRIA